MQWGILNSPPIPLDPGYPFVLDAFTSFANKLGFNKIQEFHGEYTGFGRSVSRRFYKAEGDFPLLQLGPGLFAANDSVDYDWQSFKKIVNKGASTVVANYPTLANFSLDIIQLEIRYLDTFEMSLLQSLIFLSL